MRIKVADSLAIRILRGSGKSILGDKGLAEQNDQWLGLYWQTLSDVQKIRCSKDYLRKERQQPQS